MPYGDFDPEDAYDAADPVDIRLIILGKVLRALNQEPDPDRMRRRRNEVVRLLIKIADEVADG